MLSSVYVSSWPRARAIVAIRPGTSLPAVKLLPMNRARRRMATADRWRPGAPSQPSTLGGLAVQTVELGQDAVAAEVLEHPAPPRLAHRLSARGVVEQARDRIADGDGVGRLNDGGTAAGLELGPDVHRPGRDDGCAAGERLGEDQAEVFLVGGQDEHVGRSEDAGLVGADDVAEEMHVLGNAGRAGDFFELLLVRVRTGARDQHVDVAPGGAEEADGLEQTLDTLLTVEPPQECDG